MNRSEFIQNIIGTFGISVLPVKSLRHYNKIYLLQSFVRGFRYYEGLPLLKQMNEGDLLELVREPDNPYDESAIALHFKGHKIGYIPMEDNEILSRLLDARLLKLIAEITKLEAGAKSWENVFISVYVLKALQKNELPPNAAYLTIPANPHYHSIGTKKVSRVYYKEGGEIYDGETFYEALVDNSETDEVYDLIHTGFSSPADLERAVTEMKIVINKKTLPAKLKKDKVIRALDDAEIELKHVFEEEGYVIANINRLAKLSPRIKDFRAINDKRRRKFYEVLFKS